MGRAEGPEEVVVAAEAVVRGNQRQQGQGRPVRAPVEHRVAAPQAPAVAAEAAVPDRRQQARGMRCNQAVGRRLGSIRSFVVRR